MAPHHLMSRYIIVTTTTTICSSNNDVNSTPSGITRYSATTLASTPNPTPTPRALHNESTNGNKIMASHYPMSRYPYGVTTTTIDCSNTERNFKPDNSSSCSNAQPNSKNSSQLLIPSLVILLSSPCSIKTDPIIVGKTADCSSRRIRKKIIVIGEK